MSERAEALARDLEQANDELIATVERCSGQQWGATCEGEGWTTAATARHVAGGHEFLSRMALALANGQELPPITMDQIHEMNAANAAQYANSSKEETLTLLRENGAEALDILRGLSDEQLDRTHQLALLGRASMTTQQLVERVLIRHVRVHLQSVKSAVAA